MIDLETILILVSESCRVKLCHIISNSRRAEVVDARSLYIYFSKLNGHTFKRISASISLKPNSAQFHIHRVRRLVAVDLKLQDLYGECSLAIKSFKQKYNHEKRI